LALPSVQNIPATDLPSKTSAKLYPYFSNGYFEQNFTQEELIKGKWPLVHWAYEVKGGRNQKNRWEKALS